MATGDSNDMLARIKATTPRWFSDSTPILDAILTGWATTWAFLYALYVYAKLQTRLLTATDGWLDLIAGDYFGNTVQRKPSQTDASYRLTIQANLLRERATRKGLVAMLTAITGRAPVVIEVTVPADCGAYHYLFGYGAAGAYGSMSLPYQCFLKVYRPLISTPQYGLLDADIYAAIDAIRPVDSVIWTQLLD